MAKGGGSANKSFLFQETKAVLNPKRMLEFLDEKIRSLGTAACPPYHLAVVIGGTQRGVRAQDREVRLARTTSTTCRPRASMSAHGFRDLELEEEVFKLTQSFGIGAQFGGKYFCHDVRVVRLPRHGASCPVAIAVSCSADRQALGKITAEGVFLEQLETDPAHYLPDAGSPTTSRSPARSCQVDLNQPMAEILAELSQHPVKTRLSLTGPLVVARDIAHAKIKERLDAGEEMPQYLRDHPVYYAGPAKTPEGIASGSFGPTTAGRMDSYVEQFQAAGGSMVMLAKGNRSKEVTEACDAHGGFYLGSIGGPAARLAQDCIKDGVRARVRGARHGGGLEDRGRGLPGVHRRRRQGQRLLHRPLGCGDRAAELLGSDRDPGALARVELHRGGTDPEGQHGQVVAVSVRGRTPRRDAGGGRRPPERRVGGRRRARSSPVVVEHDVAVASLQHSIGESHEQLTAVENVLLVRVVDRVDDAQQRLGTTEAAYSAFADQERRRMPGTDQAGAASPRRRTPRVSRRPA